jgi:P4 family phage/plasmid primase-like protien
MYQYIKENLCSYSPCPKVYEKCKCHRCDNYNFMSVKPGGRYYIEDLNKFYSIVSNSKETLTFLERREQYSMITLDFDRKEEGTQVKNLILDDEISNLIKDFLVLINKGKTDCFNAYKSVTLFKKSPYIKDNEYIKHGLHLQCLFLSANLESRKLLISEIKKKWGKDIDDGSNNNWLVYGCAKKSNSFSYEFDKTFTLDSGKLIEHDTLKYLEKYSMNKQYIPSKIFSTFNFNGRFMIEYKPIERVEMVTFKPKEVKHSKKLYVKEKASLKLVRSILDGISNKFYESYTECRNIVWTIKALGFDEELIEEFSAKKAGKKHDSRWISRTWNACIKDSNWNIGTLMVFLKESLEKKEYDKFIKMNLCHSFHDKNEYLLSNDDIGLAELFCILKRDDIKIINSNGNGYMWNKSSLLWVESDEKHIRNSIPGVLIPYIESTIKNIEKMINENNEVEDESESESDEDSDDEKKPKRNKKGGDKNFFFSKRKDYYENLIKSLQKSKTLPGIYSHVTTMIEDSKFMSNLNSIPNLLPIKGGNLINLETKEIRKREKSDLFTFESPVSYKQSDYKNAIRFFTSISNYGKEFVDEDEKYDPMDMVRFFQKFFGYCLTGETSDRSFYVCWGMGRNGKSTLMDIMKIILGDYLQVCTKEVLVGKEKKSGATPELLPFMGSKIVVCNELAKEDSLNADRMKALTGGDIIKVRELYQKRYFEIKPTSKILILTNEKPKLAEDPALKDRLKLIPFLASFENTIENCKYISNIKTIHIDEIFSWFVEGAYMWYKDRKLTLPGIAEKEQKEYIKEYDTYTCFIDEMCIEGKSMKVQASKIYEEYKEWCEKNDKTVLNQKNFTTRLRQKYKHHKTKKYYEYIGITLLSEVKTEPNVEPNKRLIK